MMKLSLSAGEISFSARPTCKHLEDARFDWPWVRHVSKRS